MKINCHVNYLVLPKAKPPATDGSWGRVKEKSPSLRRGDEKVRRNSDDKEVGSWPELCLRNCMLIT